MPERRDGRIRRCLWQSGPTASGVEIDVQVSFFPDGESGEVFASLVGLKEGAMLQFVIEDDCLMASRLRQYGENFHDQALGVGGPPDAPPASPISAILRCAAAMEAGVDTWAEVLAPEAGP